MKIQNQSPFCKTNAKPEMSISREIIMSIRTNGDFDTSCFTSPEAIESMNRRIEKNIERCENLIEQGNKNIDHMLVGSIENNQLVKRKKLKI